MDFVLDDLDPDLDLVGDFSSDLDLETEEFEKDFLGGDGSLAPFLLLSWEESELESLLQGLGLGLRFPFFLLSLASLFPFSLSLPRNFARGDPSEGPWDGFSDFVLSVLVFLDRSGAGEVLQLLRFLLGDRNWEW
jgi:hypothetical protein